MPEFLNEEGILLLSSDEQAIGPLGLSPLQRHIQSQDVAKIICKKFE
ncbi:hypothetical protein [Bacteroides acidifaciens]